MWCSRKLTVRVENFSRDPLVFGGEWFDTGTWHESRVLTIEEHADLEFATNVWLQGVSGYVYYLNSSYSRSLVLAFSHTLSGACFSAHSGALVDGQALWSHMSAAEPPGRGLRRSQGCVWESLELHDNIVIRCVILPQADPSRVPVPDELQRRIAKAQWCKSADDVSNASFVERRVIIETDNRSDKTFSFDGDWFESGHWDQRPSLIPRGQSKFEVVSDEMLRGVAGVCWFVNETHDCYFSLVFSHPVAADGVFGAWAGAPPAELQSELHSATSVACQVGVQVVQGRNCAWNVIENSSTLLVRVVILPKVSHRKRTPRAARDRNECTAVAHVRDRRREDEDEDEDDQDQSTLLNFINTTRPRDALDGVGSGLKAAGAGILAGAAALVAVPVMGAQEEGVTGFVTGLAKGVSAAALMAVAGGVGCATQVVRGVLNTPEAIHQSQCGKRWDSETGVWVDDTTNLREELLQVEAESDAESSDDERHGPEERPLRRVADTTYYDVIGVDPCSSSAEIKRCYYKAALRVHPDKNLDDPAASQRFQELAEAYQVLSDDKLRERYDRMGQAALTDGSLPTIDPAVFFGMLFGAEQFEKYIGKLYLATQTSHIAKDMQREFEKQGAKDVIGESLGREINLARDPKKDWKMKRAQHQREVRCAAQLCERLDRWVIGRDELGFTSDASKEASDLARVSFGPRLLRAIGTVYEICAEQWLANLHGTFTIEGHWASLRDTTRSMHLRVTAVSSIAKSAIAVKRMHDVATSSEDQEEKEEATRQQVLSLEESLPVFLQTIWDVSAVDIETTLRNVCNKILKDVSVPWQIRLRRAMALLRFGRIFRDVGQMEPTDLSQSHVAKQHLEEALYNSFRDKNST